MKIEVMLRTTCLVVYVYIAAVTVVCCFQKEGSYNHACAVIIMCFT